MGNVGRSPAHCTSRCSPGNVEESYVREADKEDIDLASECAGYNADEVVEPGMLTPNSGFPNGLQRLRIDGNIIKEVVGSREKLTGGRSRSSIEKFLHVDDLGDESYYSSLMLASASGDVDSVKELLQSRSDLEASDNCGRTPLMLAVEAGHTETVQLLCHKGADAQAALDTGQRFAPIHRAAAGGKAEIVEILLQASADVMCRAAGALTPLHLASSLNNPDICEVLLDAHADIEAVGGPGKSTALISAAETGAVECVDYLLRLRANVEAFDDRGHTALMVACDNDHASTAEKLLNHGAVIDAQDREGYTALAHAHISGNSAAARMLRRHGAKRPAALPAHIMECALEPLPTEREELEKQVVCSPWLLEPLGLGNLNTDIKLCGEEPKNVKLAVGPKGVILRKHESYSRD